MCRYVKTRRPTISPNFNFLGQLVEFDSQLTKQRQDDSTASDSKTSEDFQTSESSSVVSQIQLDAPERAASPSKRPCMVNLSRAAEARRSTAGGVDGVTVQSPTVALSRLQFVEPPTRQAASAAAVDVPPPKSTAAPDASPVPSSPGIPAADAADNLLLPTPPAPALQSKPTTSGVEQHDSQVTSSSSSSSAANTGSEDVSASHSKAGRSMSLSQGTQHEDQQQKLPSSSSWSHQSSSSSTGGETTAKGGGKYSAAAEFGGGEATTAVGAERERQAAGVMAADKLLADWPSSLKSRSLEDILLASAAAAPPPRSLGHAAAGQGHVTSQRDESRGHAAAANHGSLSSGHASLHGSREMIQVS